MKYISVKKILTLGLILAGTIFQAGAQQYSRIWQKSDGPVSTRGKQILQPVKYSTFRASEKELSLLLASITSDANTAQSIELPTPDGGYQTFSIWQSPVMPEELAAKYPGIYTLTATAVNNKRVTAKIDYTPFGFHAMIFDGRNTYFIDPYTDAADGNYMVYYKSDYTRPAGQAMACEVKDREQEELGIAPPTTLNPSGLPRLAYRQNGSVKKTYRLALACTRPYAVAVAGATPTKAAVLAKMVTSMNRINGVYEREFSYTMTFIAKEDTLININSATDPYSNNNGTAMLTQNQATIDARVGTAAYDIGHVFSTGGGGIAYPGCVCGPFKAQGVTGQANPVGDPFDIDYVAHEMGHQFGAEHTFNNNTAGFCNANSVEYFAYEPGSGSTIMAYAGICGGGNDYQSHSDVYFHSASLELINFYISTTNCGTTVSSGNANATLPSYSATYFIPSLTAFELTAPEATDATADALNYTWEERDLGDWGQSLANTRLAGPLFRPFAPTEQRTRVFPVLDSILKDRFSYNAEKVPDVSRKLAFRLVQRDIYQGLGCWNFPDDSIRLNVIHSGVPFSVTSPTSSSNWAGNSQQTVTWNVSNTTVSPISCASVDIFLSTDGGFTFPYTLAKGTPNDGSELVTLPNVNTANMRIKVKGVNNVFFAISGTGTKLGINGTAHQPEVIVSPVPAAGFITVTTGQAGESLNGRIVNTLGQLTWEGNIRGQETIQTGSWAKGIYYLQLTNASGSIQISRKLVLQ